jgi:hypothetical protein
LDYYHYNFDNEPFELYPVKTSKFATVCWIITPCRIPAGDAYTYTRTRD